jgi:hypothetical protein
MKCSQPTHFPEVPVSKCCGGLAEEPRTCASFVQACRDNSITLFEAGKSRRRYQDVENLRADVEGPAASCPASGRRGCRGVLSLP